MPLFKKVLSSTFSSSTTSSYKFDSRYIYGSYNLNIKQKRYRLNSTVEILKNYLTSDFQNDLNTLSPAQIVQFYGTHVLTDLYTGAKLEVKYQSETSNSDRTNASEIGIKAGVKEIFDIDISTSNETSLSYKNFNKRLSYRTRGGDPSKSLIGEINLDSTNKPKINISDWQNSVNESNSVIVDIAGNGYIPIYELVSELTKKEQLKNYIENYIVNNQAQLEYANPLNIQDGDVINSISTGQVFIMFEGKLRYIQTWSTFKHLFAVNDNQIRNVNTSYVNTLPHGNDFTPDSNFIRDKSTGYIYLREGRVLRLINSATIKNKYRFNIVPLYSLFIVDNTNGYFIGSPIF